MGTEAIGESLEIRPGVYADYLAMARWHYRAGAPAAPVRILRAACEGLRVGVLVVTMPTLMSRWRAVAWPELGLVDSDARGRARTLNRRVRTLARLIVDPRFRGVGVARALVAAYLNDPLTSHTEVITAMGRFSPVFERAGMRPVEVPPAPRDAALRRELAALGVRPCTLIDLQHRPGRSPAVRAALARWASRGQPTRKLLSDPDALAVAAAGALCAPPAVFVRP
jgi:GNAT superfamily N-acetyltransferase